MECIVKYFKILYICGMEIVLEITKKVPKEHKSIYNGACLADGVFYFGWRDKASTIFPLGQAIQKANIMFSQMPGLTSIKLVIEKEFSDTLKQEVLILTKG